VHLTSFVRGYLMVMQTACQFTFAQLGGNVLVRYSLVATVEQEIVLLTLDHATLGRQSLTSSSVHALVCRATR
jgi:hypothetical protein